MPVIPENTPVVITGRTAANYQERGGKMPDGAMVAPCTACRKGVVLSRDGQALLKKHPLATVLCNICALALLKARGRRVRMYETPYAEQQLKQPETKFMWELFDDAAKKEEGNG